MHNPNVTLQEEVVNYTFETVADGIPIREWLGCRTAPCWLLRSGILYHLKTANKTEVKNVPEVYIRGQGGLRYCVAS
jgi:hypothetical protein